MAEQPATGRERELATPPGAGTSNVALGMAVVLLGIMGLAVAIDGSTSPVLVLLAIVLVGGLIAALVTWG